MRQRGYGRDPELTFRMFFTMFMLGLVYIAFIGLLLFAGVDFIFIALIAVAMALFQYYGSDRLVLAATRAKVVSLILVTSRRPTDIYFIRASESALSKGLGPTLVTLLLGWWGIPWGPIYTVQSLVKNLTGGTDVTREVVASLGEADT